MRWELKPLAEVADFCLGKMLDQAKNKGEPRPYLANINVRWGEFDLADLREMRFEQDEFERYGLKAGDILMCEGGEPGRCAIWKEQVQGMMIQKALHRIRPKDGVDSNFLFYSLLKMGKSGEFSGLFTGATIKHLPREKLAMVRVPAPPPPIQYRIASILSAYDDLIENNTRRIAILEEMARRLYEEWFVNFRFPGHGDVVVGEGDVPPGWSLGRLDDIIVLQRGFDLPRDQREVGDIPVFAATGQHGTHSEAKVRGPGVVTGRSGSLGTVVYVSENFWPLNTTLWGKVFPLGTPILAYFTLSAIDLKGFNSGSAVPTLNRNDIHGLPVPIPPKVLADRFEEVIRPMFGFKKILLCKNTNLRAQRDLLLPKLISGEIDVSQMALPKADAA